MDLMEAEMAILFVFASIKSINPKIHKSKNPRTVFLFPMFIT